MQTISDNIDGYCGAFIPTSCVLNELKWKNFELLFFIDIIQNRHRYVFVQLQLSRAKWYHIKKKLL